MEPMRAQIHVAPSGVVPGFIMRPGVLLCDPAFSATSASSAVHVANDNRSLPQSAQSARREKGNPHLGESSGVVLGFTVRSWSMGS